MPRERAISEVKEPHLISLKVLRLSRPSLTEQHTIPIDTLAVRSPELQAAARYSHATDDQSNLQLTPLTPSQSIIPLKLGGSPDVPEAEDMGETLQPGGNLQRIATYDLKEEGAHVLAVMVSYLDYNRPLPTSPPGTPASGDGPTPDPRLRTFKKLYQFAATQCIMVRTKATPLPNNHAVLEAQLENLGETPMALHKVAMKTRWKARGLNWEENDPPLLRRGDSYQVCFVLEPPDAEPQAEGSEEKLATPGEDTIGQLAIEWRTSCGDKGFLKTGKLQLPSQKQVA
ncbi:Similar to UPF0533 protein C5orf44 homolog; acc. no. Q0VFT9 [Pyronema omphalodes CBS 100304]|uniref:Similar to UPF0533 protein C5orf44 homolog acc. no. Q0VFT9 n=1 Tax=Pyronema omphalodes (strain CBS 100304) TaxID=1076935 RepID=U4L7E4_PYROM|nr:Similar to UPF0533 protein C5orf44 homolog; acc. no. Q0VFT9 [Pyronema omphalodes CBS 100304]